LRGSTILFETPIESGREAGQALFSLTFELTWA